ncbi:farnesyl cysteine-carboxyl methyltransferase [Coemansia sp. RSA 552]|nr:farnesyl cysteine-carboxyl methyltransferase [Coemansia sp. RSA 552]
MDSGFRQRPAGEEKWWTPVAVLDCNTHSPPNIALTACGLGVAIGGGACAVAGLGWTIGGVFGLYVAAIALYHMLEYLSVALYNPSRVEMDSFMFNPDVGNGYIAAMALSAIEYLAEHWMFGQAKAPGLVSAVGLVLVVAGQAMRTLAMVTAKTSFNHYIAIRREQDHRLITHGIYSYERHPSYVGFFLWAVGLQLMLQNVVSGLLFAGVLGRFFVRRTRKEEAFLLRFFGNRYQEYISKTPSLIPTTTSSSSSSAVKTDAGLSGVPEHLGTGVRDD